jgi:hypothetical protein
MAGASPSEGSWNMMSCGALIRQRAIASIYCSPPDSVPADWRARQLTLRRHPKTSGEAFVGDMVRLPNQLATLEMMKCDFWKAINANCNDGRSGAN